MPPRLPAAHGVSTGGGRAVTAGVFVLLVLSTPVLTALRWPPIAEFLLNGGLLLLVLGALVRARRFFARSRLVTGGAATALVLGITLCLTRIGGGGFVPLLLSGEVLFKVAGVVGLGFALGRRGRRLGADAGADGEAVLRSTLDSIAEPIVVIDQGCRIQAVNWYAELAFTEPLVGRLCCETPYFRRESCVRCPVDQSFTTRQARFFTVRDGEGKPRYEVSAMPVDNGDGPPVRQVQHLCDVHARSQTEERLRFLGDVVASLPDVVIGTSPAGRVTAVNPRCRELLGVGEDRAVGRSVLEILRCESERDRHRLEAALAEGAATRIEVKLVHASGRPVRAVVSVGPVLDDDHRRIGLSVIVRDVTESRRVEEMLRQSDKMSSLGAFVSGLVHELNNPLSAIYGAAEALQGAAAGAGGWSEQAELVFRHAEHCRRIVDGLLRFARKSGAEKRVTDLNRIVRDTSELLGRSLAREGVTLRLRPGEHVRPVFGDAAQLQQVLVNLLSNARDSILGTGSGGTISVSTSSRNGHSVIEVEDDGAGIDPSVADQMFEAFVTTKGEGQGTGLGLSISNAIVREHGGQLEAETRTRCGALFRVRLPAHCGAIESLPAAPAAQPGGDGLRLLVVDDEPVIVEYLRNALELMGHGVVAERSGRAARERLERDLDFDLVFCDVCMPDLNGEELYRAVVTASPKYRGKFVFVTGDVLGFRLPTDDGNRVLFKPFSRRQLEEIVLARV